MARQRVGRRTPARSGRRRAERGYSLILVVLMLAAASLVVLAAMNSGVRAKLHEILVERARGDAQIANVSAVAQLRALTSVKHDIGANTAIGAATVANTQSFPSLSLFNYFAPAAPSLLRTVYSQAGHWDNVTTSGWTASNGSTAMTIHTDQMGNLTTDRTALLNLYNNPDSTPAALSGSTDSTVTLTSASLSADPNTPRLVEWLNFKIETQSRAVNLGGFNVLSAAPITTQARVRVAAPPRPTAAFEVVDDLGNVMTAPPFNVFASKTFTTRLSGAGIIASGHVNAYGLTSPCPVDQTPESNNVGSWAANNYNNVGGAYTWNCAWSGVAAGQANVGSPAPTLDFTAAYYNVGPGKRSNGACSNGDVASDATACGEVGQPVHVVKDPTCDVSWNQDDFTSTYWWTSAREGIWLPAWVQTFGYVSAVAYRLWTDVWDSGWVGNLSDHFYIQPGELTEDTTIRGLPALSGYSHGTGNDLSFAPWMSLGGTRKWFFQAQVADPSPTWRTCGGTLEVDVWRQPGCSISADNPSLGAGQNTAIRWNGTDTNDCTLVSVRPDGSWEWSTHFAGDIDHHDFNGALTTDQMGFNTENDFRTYGLVCANPQYLWSGTPGNDQSCNAWVRVTRTAPPPPPVECDKTVPAVGSLDAHLGDGAPIAINYDASLSWMNVHCRDLAVTNINDYYAQGTGIAGKHGAYHPTGKWWSNNTMDIHLDINPCNNVRTIVVSGVHETGRTVGGSVARIDSAFTVNHGCHGPGPGTAWMANYAINCQCP